MSFVGEVAFNNGFKKLCRRLPSLLTLKGQRRFAAIQKQKLASIYRGIDLKLYTEEGRPRYDLIVAPGSDPSSIKMKFRGADSIAVDKSGKLLIGTKRGSLEHRDLFAYQLVGGKKQQVPAAF